MILFKQPRVRDFAKERYLALVKTFPRLREEKTQIHIMLSLTFISLSFLGLFAISPTLATIAELNRKLEDSKFVADSLRTKMSNLSNLHTQYDALLTSWPAVERSVPDEPKVTYIIGQIQKVAKDTGVNVVSIQTFLVELTHQKQKPAAIPREASYVFTVSITGSDQQILQFLDALQHFDRTIAIEGISMTDEAKKIVTVRIRPFFLP